MKKSQEKPSYASKVAANKDHLCTVCHKVYCEPKLLPCGHLMCRKCLLSWLKQTRRATCPYCRYPILKNDTEAQALPEPSVSKAEAAQSWEQGTEWDSDDTLQKTVDQFPTDLSMEVAVKAEEVLNEKNKSCHVCDQPATSFCFQCGNTLCGACRNVHSKLVGTRHHVVEELSSLTAERLADVQTPISCPQHPEELCRLFCPQHDTSLCLLCATSRHRECSQVVEFEQLAQKSKMKLAELIKTLTNSSTEIEKAVSELDQHLADTEKRTETALADIQTLKERLTKALEDNCQKLVSQTNAAREEIREAVKEAKVVLLSRQSRLGNHTVLAQRVQASKSHVVVRGMTSVMEARLKNLECHVKLPAKAKVIRKATLVLDQSAASNVVMNLAKLGQINFQFAAIAAHVPDTFNNEQGPGVTLSDNGRSATSVLKNSSEVVINSMTVTEDVELTAVEKALRRAKLVLAGNVEITSAKLGHVDDRFHRNHGQNITLSNGSRTATEANNSLYKIVVVNRPMAVSELVEVRIDQWNPNETTYFPYLGVTVQSPDTLNLQQQKWLYEMPSATVITAVGLYSSGIHRMCRVGENLRSLRRWSRMGVYLDASLNLHLYIDGQDKGVFASSVAQPCYVLVDVCTRLKQITLLQRQRC